MKIDAHRPSAALYLVAVAVLALSDFTRASAATPASAPSTSNTIRIGLVPERDIFALRRRYLALGQYLSGKLGRPVEIATLNTYQAVLDDFSEKQIEAAVLGSFVAVLAHDRLDARILLKTETADGPSEYHGVIIVPAASKITEVDQLAGHSIALVPTTSGGQLFPMQLLAERKLLGKVTIEQVGTHDEAILGLMNGKFDAAGVKDLRLAALEKAHPELKVRVLATSKAFPNASLVVRADVADTLGPELVKVMLAMSDDSEGRKTLDALGARRYLPCDIGQFNEVYQLIERIDANWKELGISGEPPRRPASRPAP